MSDIIIDNLSLKMSWKHGIRNFFDILLSRRYRKHRIRIFFDILLLGRCDVKFLDMGRDMKFFFDIKWNFKDQ